MTVVITDAGGRKLTLRNLNVMDQVRLLRAVGADQAKNEPYMNIVQAAAAVAEVDGIPCPIPRNEQQIDGMIVRIGDAGLAAIIVHHQTEMANAAEDAARAIDDGEARGDGPLERSGT